ncbi:DUF547 domain-containing protein [Hyphococcus sp.]|uniref:DUF547 domain-containing protein n=1 Tax=Hyphococcus sp. TaxID=2038636 RepID=UPI003CCC07F2
MKQFISFTSTVIFLLKINSIALAQGSFAEFNNFTYNSTETLSHDAFASFIETYAAENESGVVLVDYGRVSQADRAALKQYLEKLQGIDPTALNKNEAFAYWANLYNALTIDIVLDNYPVESIRDIKSGLFAAGPWKKDLASVNGVTVTLDNIEHDILREFWNEPRVHYAVNCASIGCPNLPSPPFTGARLDDRLTQAAKAYVNHPRGVRVRNGRVEASSIYKWFQEDFGGGQAGVIAHLRRYAEPELAGALAETKGVERYNYDWSLNDASN